MNYSYFLHQQGWTILGNHGATSTVYVNGPSNGTNYPCFTVGQRVGFLLDMTARCVHALHCALLSHLFPALCRTCEYWLNGVRQCQWGSLPDVVFPAVGLNEGCAAGMVRFSALLLASLASSLI